MLIDTCGGKDGDGYFLEILDIFNGVVSCTMELFMSMILVT